MPWILTGCWSGGNYRSTGAIIPAEYREETIQQVAEAFTDHLRELAAHCAAKTESEWTPSDYGYGQLSVPELRQLKQTLQGLDSEIEQIYPLTPMQEGMLFHALLEPDSTAYFEQMSITLAGELEIESLASSFRKLAARHDVLRTVFVHEGVSRPLQVVLKTRELPVQIADLSELDEVEQAVSIAQWEAADRARGFNVSQDPLMRLGILRLNQDVYRIVWSSHHILMDGWCLPILMREWMELYRSACTGTPTQLEATIPYRALIDWLEEQEKEEALAYWRAYLEGYDTQAGLPQQRAANGKWSLRTTRNGADGNGRGNNKARRTGEATPSDAKHGDANAVGHRAGPIQRDAGCCVW